MCNQEIMHLAWCTNDDVHVPLFAAIGSALRCCKSAPVAIHLVTTGLSADYVERLRTLCNRLGAAEFDVVKVDGAEFANLQSTEWIPKEAHIRFLLSSVYPQLDRILYLDCDVLVCSDLLPLWQTPLDGFACAGSDKEWAHDPRYCTHIGLEPSDVYVNAGVLLMNLSRFREQDIGRRMLAFALDSKIKFPSLDQDVLNLVLRGQLKAIDWQWNFTSYEFRTRRKDAVNARVLHFTGPVKPWPTKAKRCWDWRGWLWQENYIELNALVSAVAGRMGWRDRVKLRLVRVMKRMSREFL